MGIRRKRQKRRRKTRTKGHAFRGRDVEGERTSARGGTITRGTRLSKNILH